MDLGEGVREREGGRDRTLRGQRAGGGGRALGANTLTRVGSALDGQQGGAEESERRVRCEGGQMAMVVGNETMDRPGPHLRSTTSTSTSTLSSSRLRALSASTRQAPRHPTGVFVDCRRAAAPRSDIGRARPATTCSVCTTSSEATHPLAYVSSIAPATAGHARQSSSVATVSTAGGRPALLLTMPRGVPKSASAVSVPSTSTRTASARSAKTKANASLMDHADADIDALIRKHDKKGARGFGKTRGAAAATATADIDSARSRSPTTISTAAEAEAAEAATVRGQVTSGAGRSDLGTDGLMSEGNGESNVIEQAPSDPPKPTKKSASKKATTTSSSKKAAAGTKARKGTKTVSAKRQIQDSATSRTDENEADYAKRPARILGETAHHTNRLAAPPFETRNKEVEANMSDSPGKLPRSPHKHKSPKKVAAYLQSPVSRGKRKAMSEGQIQSFLDNYDLEGERSLNEVTCPSNG